MTKHAHANKEKISAKEEEEEEEEEEEKEEAKTVLYICGRYFARPLPFCLITSCTISSSSVTKLSSS
jgi:CO dehydrogenase/acetyl-CoA synthase beta subunit